MTERGSDFGELMKGIRSKRQQSRTTSIPGDLEIVQRAVTPIVEKFIAEDRDLWVASSSDHQVIIQYGSIRACWVTVLKSEDDMNTVRVSFHSDEDQTGYVVWLGNRKMEQIQEALGPCLLRWYQTLF